MNRVVAVVRWLRDHPGVEAGPSVRASLALADLADAWHTLTGADDLLPAALLALPHRIRVRAGVDAEELVRQAVADVELVFLFNALTFVAHLIIATFLVVGEARQDRKRDRDRGDDHAPGNVQPGPDDPDDHDPDPDR